MTPLVNAIAQSSAGSSAAAVILDLRQTAAGWQAAVTDRDIAAEDALWDSVSARHPDALDALLASLNERADRGEDTPLDLNQF